MSQQKCILWRTEILKSDSWKDKEKAGEYTSDFGPQPVFKSFPLIIAMHFQPSKNKFLEKKRFKNNSAVNHVLKMADIPNLLNKNLIRIVGSRALGNVINKKQIINITKVFN